MSNDPFVVKFMKSLQNFDKTCGSCKFLDLSKGVCKVHKVEVSNKDPKCDKWRYGC